MYSSYDIIVVGAGHAGCEAAQCSRHHELARFADYNEYADHCADVMQPGDGGRCERANCAGSRCTGRNVRNHQR